MDKNKVQDIEILPPPKAIKKVFKFLGHVGFHRGL